MLANCIGSVSWNSNYVRGTARSWTNSCTMQLAGSGANVPILQDGMGTITNQNARFADLAGGNYRLAPSSPCINGAATQDRGAAALDLDRHRRVDPFWRLPDMGCYEFRPPGTLVGFQ